MQLGYLIYADMNNLLPFKGDPDHEECAVILGTRTTRGKVWVHRSLWVPNRADDTTKFFRVLTRDIPEDVLPQVVGVAHTHIDNPGVSYYDIMKLNGTDFFGLMYHAASETVKLYDALGWIQNTSWRLHSERH